MMPDADTARVMSTPAATPSDSEMYERMVAAIRDHRLLPGTKLGEDKLATAFGVSRTRIRPVLVRLASEQVVTLTPNRGATVAQPSMQEAREVFEVRRMIEPLLVERFIASAQVRDIERLADCIAQEEAARAAGQARLAIRLSGDFHLHIAQAAAHQTLGRILRELVARTSLVLMRWGASASDAAGEPPGAAAGAGPACACREHRALLDAIRLRDAREARRLMLAHLAQLESQLHFAAPGDPATDLARLLAAAP
jgi:DNA-binding GntR family transcriptional regulator